jgi:hypothetical protein
VLLCGYPPFTGKSENEIMEKVKKGKFKFDRIELIYLQKPMNGI